MEGAALQSEEGVYLRWQWQRFSQLTSLEIYEILALRQSIFIVEQDCVYQDADGFDQESFHLSGRDKYNKLCVYARVNYPGSRYAEPSIGRLITVPQYRRKGIASKALQKAIEKCRKEFECKMIKISAQYHLKKLYSSFGFRSVGNPYDEDGIDHIDMLLETDG